MQGVDQSRGSDNSGAMLVIMEDRDIHFLAQALFNNKTFRRANIFQINAAKRRTKQTNRIHKFIYFFGIKFQINPVNIGEFLKQNRFTFHNWLRGYSPDIA